MVYVWQLVISMCIGEAARIEMTHSWSDCDERSPAPDWVEVWTQSFKDLRTNRPITYLRTNVDTNRCNEFFMYFPEFDDYVKLQYGSGYDDTMDERVEFCYVKAGGDADFCKVEKKQKMWNYVVESVREKCMAKLCNYAKTGKWKAGWFKKTDAKSMAWKGEMPGHNSWGYKDVFKYKCWHGPKSYGDLLDFDAFARHYDNDLTTPSGTFNKKVCGCRSADDCTGHYKPGELYHRSG
mmetsp:Transcript_65976/g.144704  ORF Transcript_65976/g.144704 Transcript_65976/m.144704 type:complete len:237 (-) Transcript_65976:28-738(-)